MQTEFVKRGGIWVALQFVLMGAVFASGLLWSRQVGNTLQFTGGALLFLGALCGILGASALDRNLTPFPEPLSSGKLVRGGIYGWVRHPLYVAVFSAALGWAVLRGSPVAVGLAIVLGVFLDAKARREETRLRAKFPDYENYSREVSRFFPRLY